jgi:outer membrane protein OmpA-like peptidoglycan-associated protein
MKKTLVLLAVCLLSCFVQAADLPGSKDNPFVSRFEGSSILRYKAANYDTLGFRGMDKEKKALAEPVSVEGKMVRIGYDVPGGQASSLEVYRNYENALKENGFEIQASLQVDSRSAGDFTCQRNFPGLSPYHSQNDYYLYATKDDPSGKVHLSVFVAEMNEDENDFKKGDVVVFVDSIQQKAVTKKMVDGTSGDMAKQIAATGSVNLYGIYFDTDKTEIKPQSKPTLDEVGKLLAGDAGLKLKVVGHTDNVGTAEYNNSLSLLRAQAVAGALVHDYNIAAERLTALGAGFTQPVASNDTEEGRAKNRRVELVKI